MIDSGKNRGAVLPPAHSATHIASRQWIAMVLAGVLGVVLFAGTAGAILYRDLSSQVSASVLDTSGLKKPAAQSEPESDEPPVDDSFAGRPVNILMMGSDARVGQSEAVVNPLDDDESMRSDTTLVMNISADRQSVTLVSIPRDIWMYLPECTRSDGSVSYEQWGQFNWAFSYGSGGTTEDVAGAVACTERTVEQISGLTLDGFALVDFNGFAAMIDALGGIDICLENEIADSEYLGITFPAGCQQMDGTTATQFARLRHADTIEMSDGSDMARIQRQQQMIGSMAKKALTTNMLTDLPALYQFASAALDSTVISPSLGSVSKIAGLARSLQGMDPANIRFTTMPVLTADFDPNRLIPWEPLNEELWTALRYDQPLPAGVVYQDMNGEWFTVQADGTSVLGGNPRTDDMIGSFQGWYPSDNG